MTMMRFPSRASTTGFIRNRFRRWLTLVSSASSSRPRVVQTDFGSRTWSTLSERNGSFQDKKITQDPAGLETDTELWR
jgi:hypothetical protein